jgi:hypothetical protein
VISKYADNVNLLIMPAEKKTGVFGKKLKRKPPELE